MIPRINPKSDPLRRSLPLNEWPEAGRAAWVAARTSGDPLEPANGGLAAHWRPATVKGSVQDYGRYLAFLKRKGLLESETRPQNRVTPELVRAYVTELQTLNGSASVASRIRRLRCMVNVMWAEEDWDWLKPVIRNLARKVVPVRDKRSRIVPVEDLLAFGLELMAQGERAETGSLLDKALLYRDGLMIALLAARLLRERNFAAIEIDRHLVLRDGTYWLCFEGAETKTHHSIELPVREDFTSYLKRYIDFYRPLLFPRNRGSQLGTAETGEGCKALWLSLRGRAMPPNTVYERITKLTRAKFGHPIYPQLFRDCAATSIANDDPANVGIAPRVLGHSTFKTTENYYIHARQGVALKRYQHEIGTLRGGEA